MSVREWVASGLVMLAYRLGGCTPAHIADWRLPAHASAHIGLSSQADERQQELAEHDDEG